MTDLRLFSARGSLSIYLAIKIINYTKFSNQLKHNVEENFYLSILEKSSKKIYKVGGFYGFKVARHYAFYIFFVS